MSFLNLLQFRLGKAIRKKPEEIFFSSPIIEAKKMFFKKDLLEKKTKSTIVFNIEYEALQ